MFAGGVVAFGLWVLMQMLGIGIGMIVVDPEKLSERGLGIAAIIWTFGTPMIALFFGGLVAGRLSATFERRLGALHGLVVWALTATLGIATTLLAVGALGALRIAQLAAVNAEGAVYVTPTQHATSSGADQLHAAGYLLLYTGIGMLLGLIASVFGGALGTRRRRRTTDIVETTTTIPPAHTTTVTQPPAPYPPAP